VVFENRQHDAGLLARGGAFTPPLRIAPSVFDDGQTMDGGQQSGAQMRDRGTSGLHGKGSDAGGSKCMFAGEQPQTDTGGIV